MSILNQEERAAPTTPPAGTMNHWVSNDSVSRLYGKDDAGLVRPYSQIIFTSTDADFTGTNVNTAQPVFNTTEDVLTIEGATAYIIQASYHIHTTGTTSHQLGLLFGGTATFTSCDGIYHATNAATEVLGALSSIPFTSAAVVNVSPATATATHHNIIINGIIRVNAGGTIIPQYQWSAAPGVAGVVLRGAWFMLTPMGVNTIKCLPAALWS